MLPPQRLTRRWFYASWQGFVAARVVLGAEAPLGTAPLAQLLTMGSPGKKSPPDKHHLFPDRCPKERGNFSNRSNRANLTYPDYQNNICVLRRRARRLRAALPRRAGRRGVQAVLRGACPARWVREHGLWGLPVEEARAHGPAGEEGVREAVRSNIRCGTVVFHVVTSA